MVDFSDTFKRAAQYVDERDSEGSKALSEEVMRTSRSYRESTEGKALKPVRSAINDNEIAPIAETTRDEYKILKQRAYQAQEIWALIPVSKRAEFMQIFAKKLEAVQEQIAYTIIDDVGKSKNDTKGEMAKALEWLSWASRENTAKLFAPKQGHGESRDKVTVKKPAGLVGVMTSFNYPLALSIAGIIPGLLSGNAVMLKAASIAPHWAYFFQDAFKEAMNEFFVKEQRSNILTTNHWTKIPEAQDLLANNLFSVIHGRENTLLTDCDNLFFVGGTDTGNAFQEQRDFAAQESGRVLTTHLELGGNSAAIVLGSAFEEEENVQARAEAIAKEIFAGAIGNSGQRCTGARLFVRDESDGAQLTFEKLKDLYTQGINVGNPWHDNTTSGVLVDSNAFDKMQLVIAAAKAVGAGVIGGERLGGNIVPINGIYVNPAMVDWSNISDEVLDRQLVDILGEEFVMEHLSQSEYEKWGSNFTLKNAIQHETFAPLLNVLRKVQNKEQAAYVANEYDREQLACGAYGSKEDLDYLEEEIKVTSFKRNGAPKDQSPDKEHGNWGRRFHTGGEHAMDSFTREEVLDIHEDRDQVRAQGRIHGMNGLAAA